MRNAPSFATRAEYVTGFALPAAALLLAGCEIHGLADAVGDPDTEFRVCAACPAMVTVPAVRLPHGGDAGRSREVAVGGEDRILIADEADDASLPRVPAIHVVLVRQLGLAVCGAAHGRRRSGVARPP